MSLLIGKAIYYLLANNEAVVTTVTDSEYIPVDSNDKGGIKIYPIAADECVKNPYIAFIRSSVNPNYSKDGLEDDDNVVEIACATDDYLEGLDIINKVRTAIELKSGVFDGVNVTECRFLSAKEFWGDDSYIQSVMFSIRDE